MTYFMTWAAIITAALCLYASAVYAAASLAHKFAMFVARKFQDDGL
jgi:hypothetical protein